jgi:hypothetical protein
MIAACCCIPYFAFSDGESIAFGLRAPRRIAATSPVDIGERLVWLENHYAALPGHAAPRRTPARLPMFPRSVAYQPFGPDSILRQETLIRPGTRAEHLAVRDTERQSCCLPAVSWFEAVSTRGRDCDRSTLCRDPTTSNRALDW